ncbi:hypothetical protein IZ6_16840 [Terrihabitans soli]|uniref:Sulfur globule protein n=1 Tax=Terrihabitans soli TaxID=708113 RepID=A0A6S6QPM6_9HYPH|nr:sulfur globule protein precursor [Terrihabitans soli]BCJ90949.1 hypothetical protein IZ6_16840 [Terrihabitans soli]
MLRKTLIGAAAALTLGAAALIPSSASAHGGHGHGHGGVSVHFGGGGFGFGGYGPGYYNTYWGGPSCYKKSVKVFDPYLGGWVWTKKKICY